MYLLDSDHLTLLERGTQEGLRLKIRLAALPPDDKATTIITYEEQTRGRLAFVSQAKTSAQQVEAYNRLHGHVRFFRLIPIVGFDEKAATEFARLQTLRLRAGTLDLKIAAIALANNAVLLSRNLQHFAPVPGLTVEDWTV